VPVNGPCVTSDTIHQKVKELLESNPVIVEGEPWIQGDHSMFLQRGRPAIAVTSAWMLEHMYDQTITHTPADIMDNVDCGKLVDLAGIVSLDGLHHPGLFSPGRSCSPR